jgi:hypothetical protein
LRELTGIECQPKIRRDPRHHEEQQKDERKLNEGLPSATIQLQRNCGGISWHSYYLNTAAIIAALLRMLSASDQIRCEI